MTLRSGDKTAWISIQQRTGETDSIGQPIDAWGTIVSLWSKVLGQTGMRTIQSANSGVMSTSSPYSFRINYREGLTPGMRVMKGSQSFPVLEVRMDYENREWTDLVCRSVAVSE